MGMAGMALGIIALVFNNIFPLFGLFVAIPCVAVGLPLSGLAFEQARKAQARLVVPIAGLVINLVMLSTLISWAAMWLGWISLGPW